MEHCEVAKIPVEKAMEILKENGLEVTAEQTKDLLEFLYKIAEITLSKYFSKP